MNIQIRKWNGKINWYVCFHIWLFDTIKWQKQQKEMSKNELGIWTTSCWIEDLNHKHSMALIRLAVISAFNLNGWKHLLLSPYFYWDSDEKCFNKNIHLMFVHILLALTLFITSNALINGLSWTSTSYHFILRRRLQLIRLAIVAY